MAKYVIMSDIHGNMPALEAVVADICVLKNGVAGIFLLGDLIDYGMQSNEVVSFVRDELEKRVGASIVASIWGNHERVCMLGVDFDRLSSERTVASAKYTASVLTEETKAYIRDRMEEAGRSAVTLKSDMSGIDGVRAEDDWKVLAVHGSLNDSHFGGVFPDDVQGDYGEYNLVLSGHTHFPHIFTKFYPCEDDRIRNKKPTVFINPGSVGQPRNRNPLAQYAVWDSATGQAELRAVPYDVEKTMSMYHGQVDDFYRERLKWGV